MVSAPRIKRRDRAKLFSIAADEWLALKSLTLAESSQRIERDNLKHLRPEFEKRLVTDIQAKDVSRYQQARLAEGAAPKTINLEVGTLRAILRRHRVWAEIQQDVRMLPVPDDVGRAITEEEEAALLTACLQSRCRCLYVAVVLALNTLMRYNEIRLLRWRQIDFVSRMLTAGKSKSPTGTGRAIPLNNRILSVLEMWAEQFPLRQPAHFVFPPEKYGAAGMDGSFGFTAGPVTYDTDPTRPIGDWKEGWEKAKKQCGYASVIFASLILRRRIPAVFVFGVIRRNRVFVERKRRPTDSFIWPEKLCPNFHHYARDGQSAGVGLSEGVRAVGVEVPSRSRRVRREPPALRHVQLSVGGKLPLRQFMQSKKPARRW